MEEKVVKKKWKMSQNDSNLPNSLQGSGSLVLNMPDLNDFTSAYLQRVSLDVWCSDVKWREFNDSLKICEIPFTPLFTHIVSYSNTKSKQFSFW